MYEEKPMKRHMNEKDKKRKEKDRQEQDKEYNLKPLFRKGK